MDLKVYYQKMRQIEAALGEAHVVVVSQETPDGGRAGVRTEVPRLVAAKLIVEGRARLATAEEASEYREQTAEAKRAAEQAATAGRMQITVISEADLRALKGATRSKA
ncbi:MAG: hypothetical protein ABSE56_02200 [Bryobacteraceae bacterium]|jgi:hypothetical protein